MREETWDDLPWEVQKYILEQTSREDFIEAAGEREFDSDEIETFIENDETPTRSARS